MAVKFGVFVPQGWRMDLVEIADPVEQYEAMTNVAKAADALNIYDSIWVFDHFHTVPRPTLETTFEAWTITAALARDTQRVKVGQMVTCNGYRNPALLAKMASTVDVLSHGRLYCGLGAGWYEHEWKAYGYGFPETKDRMGSFRDACEIVTRMWYDDYATYEGKYHSVKGAINQPKGVQKPHPSFWIGGSGERVTLKLVAKYGDACNIGGDPETLRAKLDVLRRHCDEVGRDYNQIIRSNNSNIFLVRPGDDLEKVTEAARKPAGMSLEEFRNVATIGTPEQIIEHLRARVEAGADYLIVTLPRLAYDHEQLHWFAEEVAPHVG